MKLLTHGMITSIVYIRFTHRIYTVNKLEVCVYIFFSFDLGMWLAWLISVITHVSWFFFSRTLSLRFIYPEISLMAYKIYKCRRITHQNGFLTGEFKLPYSDVYTHSLLMSARLWCPLLESMRITECSFSR